MTTPTPEQVAAARRLLTGQRLTPEDALDLTSYAQGPSEPMRSIAIRVLMDALEAAEADSARLDWLEKGGALPSFVKGIWYGRAAQGYTEHDNLRAAIDVTMEAQP